MQADRQQRRRYRKVSTRVWGDDKFRALSRPQPSGQFLWFHLVFGPHTGVIPGLSVAGEASLAEALEWPAREFRRCFSEIADQGMAVADWSARVVWLPNAVHYNEPESLNVVKGWAKALDAIPDCDLKGMAIAKLQAYLQGIPQGYAQAFAQGLAQYRVKASYIQKQDQEQEQKQEGVFVSTEDEIAERAARFIERYEVLYPQHRAGARYLVKPARDHVYAMQLCRTWPDARLDHIAAFFLTTDHQFAKNGSRTIGQLTALASWCDSQLTEKRSSRPKGCTHIPACVDAAAHTSRYLAEQKAS